MTSPSCRVRPATDADRPAVERLGRRLTEGVAPWRPAEAVATAVDGWIGNAFTVLDPLARPMFVAETDDGVIGFVTGGIRRHWAGDVDAYIGEIAVDPAAARSGVGKALVGAVVQWAHSRGHTRICLETGFRNAGALAFYRHLGFEPEEVILTRAIG